MKWLTTVLKAQNEAKNLHAQIQNQNTRIKNLMEEYKELSDWNSKYVETLGMLTEALQAMIWKKDEKDRYVLANPTHCRSFFGFEGTTKCLNYVVGKTDVELINEVFLERNIPNTFPDVCSVSDGYIKDKDNAVHFLEAGKIDTEEILLYTVKTPQFDMDGKFTGSVGMSWDMTDRSAFLTKQLNRWIYSDMAVKLYHEKDVFCYAIIPEVKQCGIFKHVCPHPQPNNNIECDACRDKNGCFIKREKINDKLG